MTITKRFAALAIAAAAATMGTAVASAPAQASTIWNPVQIERIQWKGGQEYVKVRNTGKINAVNIGNWTLRNQFNAVRYTFPAGFMLPPGRAVFVYTDPAPALPDVPGTWTDEAKNYTGGPSFNLWPNSNGTVVLRKAFGPPADVCSYTWADGFNKWC